MMKTATYRYENKRILYSKPMFVSQIHALTSVALFEENVLLLCYHSLHSQAANLFFNEQLTFACYFCCLCRGVVAYSVFVCK